MRSFIDTKGYKRKKLKFSSLVHRQNAYKYIYKPNRDKYPLPFGEYQVHHVDGNKRNNHSSNLCLVTRDEHERAHKVGKYQPGLFIRLLRAFFR